VSGRVFSIHSSIDKCQQLQLALTEVQTEVMRLRGIGMSEKVTYVEDTIKVLNRKAMVAQLTLPGDRPTQQMLA
jgi:hypothetical protein